MGNVINIVLTVFVFLLWISVAIKFISQSLSAPKSEKAQVVDKYIQPVSPRLPAVLASEKYIVVFETKNKKLSFYVSGFSYGGYAVGEKGTLRYKGKQIIGFKEE